VTFSLKTHLGECAIDSPLMADFNVDNLLAAIAVLIAQEISLDEISQNINKISAITGRMESFSSKGKATAIVDYAHTPDALENALKACRQHCQGQLWVVFGCGGDRDKGKRALMGQVAENLADNIVITNDNPRSESPAAIAKDILTGCKKPEKITVLLAREQAVLATLKQAKAQDFVLFAGKGHEDYIIVGNETLAYNERAVVNDFYQNGARL
jgi:UDP-N-acetylmuramoyl-L-alanyl-D-glutamate--2,6-diaminopimelate ligase